MQQQNTKIQAQIPKTEQVQKKKKTNVKKTLKAEDFEKANGLKALYEMSQKLNLQNAETNIDLSMKKIAVTLKSWQYNMMPKYSYDLFIQRCQVLGSEKFLMNYMNNVRKIHKGQANWVSQNTGNQNEAEQRKENINNLSNHNVDFNQGQRMDQQMEYDNQINQGNKNIGFIPLTTPHDIQIDMNIAQDFQKLDQIQRMIQKKRAQVLQANNSKPFIEGYQDGIQNFDFYANQYDQE